MKKTIEFTARINSQEFDAQVSRIQNRLKNMYDEGSRSQTVRDVRGQAVAAGIPGVQSPGSGLDPKVKQSIREMTDFGKQQFELSEKTLKALKSREDQLKKLRDLERDLLKDGKSTLEVKEKIIKAEEARQRLGQQYDRRAGAFQNSQDSIKQLDPTGMYRISEGYKSGGVAGAAKAGVGAMGGGMAVAGGLLSGISALISTLAPLARQFASMPRQISGAQGAATAGTAGDLYGQMAQGRGSDFFYYRNERSRASQMAMRELGTNRIADKAEGIGSGLGVIGGAIGAAAATGPIGLAAGIGALGYGAYNLATNDRARLGLMSNFSESSARDLRGLQNREFVSNMQDNFESEKMKDPLKGLSRERYFQNMGRDLETQRALGMNSNEFYGGYFSKGFNAGFSDNSLIGASQGIMGAGGGTDSARNNSVFSLQMQRNFGLSNSNQILGGFGRNMDAKSSESSTIKVMAEAVKLGLDRSEFAQEQRDFVQTAANYATGRGSISAESVAQQASEFSGFMRSGSVTRGSIDAAQGASQVLEGMMSDTSGPGGVQFQAALSRDSRFSDLSPTEKIAISNMGGNINADDPIIKSIAARKKLTPEEFAGQLRNTRVGTAGGPLINAKESLAAGGGEINQDSIADISTKLSAFYPQTAGLQPEVKNSLATRLLRGDIQPGDMSGEIEKINKGLSAGSATGRIQDTEEAAVANQSKLLNNEFMLLKNTMQESAAAASNMGKEMFEAIQKINAAMSASKELGPETYNKLIQDVNFNIPPAPNTGKSVPK